MKNFKKFTAFAACLCMLFSLSVAAFAAEADEHTVYESAPDEEITVQFPRSCNQRHDSGQQHRWSLDQKGWLTISGSGRSAGVYKRRRSAVGGCPRSDHRGLV